MNSLTVTVCTMHIPVNWEQCIEHESKIVQFFLEIKIH